MDTTEGSGKDEEARGPQKTGEEPEPAPILKQSSYSANKILPVDGGDNDSGEKDVDSDAEEEEGGDTFGSFPQRGASLLKKVRDEGEGGEGVNEVCCWTQSDGVRTSL